MQLSVVAHEKNVHTFISTNPMTKSGYPKNLVTEEFLVENGKKRKFWGVSNGRQKNFENLHFWLRRNLNFLPWGLQKLSLHE